MENVPSFAMTRSGDFLCCLLSFRDEVLSSGRKLAEKIIKDETKVLLSCDFDEERYVNRPPPSFLASTPADHAAASERQRFLRRIAVRNSEGKWVPNESRKKFFVHTLIREDLHRFESKVSDVATILPLVPCTTWSETYPDDQNEFLCFTVVMDDERSSTFSVRRRSGKFRIGNWAFHRRPAVTTPPG